MDYRANPNVLGIQVHCFPYSVVKDYGEDCGLRSQALDYRYLNWQRGQSEPKPPKSCAATVNIRVDHMDEHVYV